MGDRGAMIHGLVGCQALARKLLPNWWNKIKKISETPLKTWKSPENQCIDYCYSPFWWDMLVFGGVLTIACMFCFVFFVQVWFGRFCVLSKDFIRAFIFCWLFWWFGRYRKRQATNLLLNSRKTCVVWSVCHQCGHDHVTFQEVLLQIYANHIKMGGKDW